MRFAQLEGPTLGHTHASLCVEGFRVLCCGGLLSASFVLTNTSPAAPGPEVCEWTPSRSPWLSPEAHARPHTQLAAVRQLRGRTSADSAEGAVYPTGVAGAVRKGDPERALLQAHPGACEAAGSWHQSRRHAGESEPS